MIGCSCAAKNTPQKKEKNKTDVRIQHHFEKDGSYKPWTNILMNNLVYPESYKHIHTKHWEFIDGIVVKSTFRIKTNDEAKIEIITVFLKFDYDGELIGILTAEVNKIKKSM
jgi:hypothetical protein